MFLFEKIDKNVQFLCFSEIPKIFICVHVRQVGGFFIQGRKKLSVLKQSPFFGFRFRDAWKESIQKTDRIKRVCPSQQGLFFRAWPIHAGFTVTASLLFENI